MEGNLHRPPGARAWRLLWALVRRVIVPAGWLALAASDAQAAGFRSIEVPADDYSPALAGAMWYPCAEPPTEINLGSITVTGTKDCPIRGSKLPLVVISHGNIGAYYDHHDTAAALADAGFVVAAISHRGDTSPPTFAAGADPSVMPGRPADMRRLIDFMIGTSAAHYNIDPGRVGFFGFSAGAYTGLLLMGARPDWAGVMCRFAAEPRACTHILGEEFRTRPNAPESRIKAAVLADPAGMWLAPNGLVLVKAPIQLWASETGGRGLPNIVAGLPAAVAAVDKGLPNKHEYHVVPNAGHFAFMLCGPSIKAIPEFCVDAPGFDRVAFHKQFNAEVARFFRAQLGAR